MISLFNGKVTCANDLIEMKSMIIKERIFQVLWLGLYVNFCFKIVSPPGIKGFLFQSLQRIVAVYQAGTSLNELFRLLQPIPSEIAAPWKY